MSETPNLVRAVNPNGIERDVPAHWLDQERSPFPGRWKAAKEDKAPVQKEAPVGSVAGDGHEDTTTKPKGA